MTIDELIELAGEAREDLGGDAQVRIVWQPGWPLRGQLQCATIPPSTDPDDLYAADQQASGQQNDGRSRSWPQAMTFRTARTRTHHDGRGTAPNFM